jgi:predicted esterase
MLTNTRDVKKGGAMKRSDSRTMRQLIQCVVLLTLLFILFVQPWFGQIVQQKLFLGDIDIIPPAADLPQAIAALSGRWEGVSEHGILVAMVFKALFPDRADIVRGFGPDLANMTVVNESVHILPGDRPTLTWNSPQETISLTLSEDFASLVGVSERNGVIADSATLRKTQQFMATPRSEPLLPLEFAKGWSQLEEQRIFRQKLKTQIKNQAGQAYIVYTPKDYERNPHQTWPLLLFLHGRGERGTDLRWLLKHGPLKLVMQGQDFPFLLIAPQITEDYLFFPPEFLKDVLDDVVAAYRVDQDRVYVTGLSMGGYGTWGVALAYPRRFAAIAPIAGGNPLAFGGSGGYDHEIVCGLKHLPVWAFHGAKDDVVPLAAEQQIVDELKQCGGNVRLTIYPDADHENSWTRAYSDPELYEWLLQHTLK